MVYVGTILIYRAGRMLGGESTGTLGRYVSAEFQETGGLEMACGENGLGQILSNEMTGTSPRTGTTATNRAVPLCSHVPLFAVVMGIGYNPDLHKPASKALLFDELLMS